MARQANSTAWRLSGRHEPRNDSLEVALLARGIQPIAHVSGAVHVGLAVIMFLDTSEAASDAIFTGALQRGTVSGVAGQPFADSLDGTVDDDVACRRARTRQPHCLQTLDLITGKKGALAAAEDVTNCGERGLMQVLLQGKRQGLADLVRGISGFCCPLRKVSPVPRIGRLL